MRNKAKTLDDLHIYLFDFMSSFSAMTLSFTFHLLDWNVVGKELNKELEDLSFSPGSIT